MTSRTPYTAIPGAVSVADQTPHHYLPHTPETADAAG
ncbi:hypothetical protein ACS0PU_006078 [Formica fusca]